MKSRIIAFLSFWPIVYFPIHVSTEIAAVVKSCDLPYWLWLSYKVTSIIGVVTFWLYYGTIIYFLVQIFKHKVVPEEQRLKWGAAIFFFGIISFPIFWFKYMRHQDKTAQQVPEQEV